MCSCLDSNWLIIAKRLIANINNPNDPERQTLEYLISNNHCGIEKRIDIDSVVRHLNNNGHDYTRETFQQTVLGKLKRNGAVATLIYPGPQGGLFIPCNSEDVNQALRQILSRVEAELENISGITQILEYHEEVQNIIRSVNNLVGRIR